MRLSCGGKGNRRQFIWLLFMIFLLNPLGGFLTYAGENSSVFLLDSLSGDWMRLPSENTMATPSTQGENSGACDKEEWENSITIHAKVHAFDKGIVKTATPLTGNIRTLNDNSFEVPLFQEASWLVRIMVSNSNAEEMNEVLVADNFPAEFALQSIKVSQGKVNINLTGEAQKAHLVWNIGDLSPGAKVQLEMVVTTKPNPAGNQEFTSTGLHELNPGAVLSYRLNGQTIQAQTEPIYVHAVEPGVWESRSNVESKLTLRPMNVQTLTVRGIAADTQTKCVSTIQFHEQFEPISPEISVIPAHKGFPDGFQVPQGLRVEWRLIITVVNPLSAPVTNVVVTEHLGAELDVAADSVQRTPSEGSLAFERRGNVKIEWKMPRLDSGQKAVLSLIVYTRNNNGHQLYSSPTIPRAPNYLNSGAVVKYFNPKQNSLCLDPVPVWVKEGSYIRVALNATRYDWQIRKPGEFSADSIKIMVCSNHKVTVAFSQFSDLKGEEGGNIPAYYGFGNSLSEADQTGWIRASFLNSRSMTTSKIGDVNEFRLWPKIQINDRIRAGEYQDVGYITFTIVECDQFIDSGSDEAPKQTQTWVKGVTW